MNTQIIVTCLALLLCGGIGMGVYFSAQSTEEIVETTTFRQTTTEKIVATTTESQITTGFDKTTESPLVTSDSPSGNETEIINISLDQGILSGYYLNFVDTFFFQNIPYAQPPVGENRFEPPNFEDLPSWEGIRDGTQRTNRCLQHGLSSVDSSSYHYDEDCLFLEISSNNLIVNADTKQVTPKTKLQPVMINIHGGAFQTGSGMTISRDNYYLAHAADVVVVNINYRLGYLGTANFKSEFLGKTTYGNFNFMDQYAAITWVQNNIHKFGGDPDNLNLMGESAGAESVIQHLVWEDSRKKFNFKNVFAISWPLLPYNSIKAADDLNKRYARRVNCWIKDTRHPLGYVDKECMKQQDGLELINLTINPVGDIKNLFDDLWSAFQYLAPTVDGNIVEEQPVFSLNKLVESGEQLPNLIPIASSNEGANLIGFLPRPLSLRLATLVADVTLHGYGPEVIQFYTKQWMEENNLSDQSEIEDYKDLMISAVTDYTFYCTSRKYASLFPQGYLMNWARPYKIYMNNNPSNYDPNNQDDGAGFNGNMLPMATCCVLFEEF